MHLEEEWVRDITITTGLVDTNYTPTLFGEGHICELIPGRDKDHNVAIGIGRGEVTNVPMAYRC